MLTFARFPVGGKKLKVFLLLLICLSLTSCKYFRKKSGAIDESPVARVQDEYLYYSDIEPVLKSAESSNDSASFVRNYINDWIKRKLMLDKASLYLPEDQLDIERQVNDYRESLILYAYEKELILQKLDTVVSDVEARNYFETYKLNFKLAADVLQMQYVKVAKDAPKLDSVITWMASNNENDKIKLEEYCYQYAAEFSLNDSAWFEKPAVLKTIPVGEASLEVIMGYKTRTTVSDSLYHYALKVNDFIPKGEIAPFEFVKDAIIRITLNKRKMDLIRSTYDNIYNEAQVKNEFEIYK